MYICNIFCYLLRIVHQYTVRPHMEVLRHMCRLKDMLSYHIHLCFQYSANWLNKNIPVVLQLLGRLFQARMAHGHYICMTVDQ